MTEIKPDLGKKSLELPISMNEQFNSIKNFGNFKRWFAHNFFHAFYSLGISIAMNDPEILNNIQEIGKKSFNFNPKKEEMRNSIDSTQLERHDILFKTIAYWILMKQNDPDCYRVIVRTNEARELCQEVFFRFWAKYYDELRNQSTQNPNIHLLGKISFD